MLALAVCLSPFRYCGALDGVLAGHVTDISRPEQKRLFHQFLSLSMSSGKYQVHATVSSLSRCVRTERNRKYDRQQNIDSLD